MNRDLSRGRNENDGRQGNEKLPANTSPIQDEITRPDVLWKMAQGGNLARYECPVPCHGPFTENAIQLRYEDGRLCLALRIKSNVRSKFEEVDFGAADFLKEVGVFAPGELRYDREKLCISVQSGSGKSEDVVELPGPKPYQSTFEYKSLPGAVESQESFEAELRRGIAILRLYLVHGYSTAKETVPPGKIIVRPPAEKMRQLAEVADQAEARPCRDLFERMIDRTGPVRIIMPQLRLRDLAGYPDAVTRLRRIAKRFSENESNCSAVLGSSTFMTVILAGQDQLGRNSLAEALAAEAGVGLCEIQACYLRAYQEQVLELAMSRIAATRDRFLQRKMVLHITDADDLSSQDPSIPAPQPPFPWGMFQRVLASYGEARDSLLLLSFDDLAQCNPSFLAGAAAVITVELTPAGMAELLERHVKGIVARAKEPIALDIDYLDAAETLYQEGPPDESEIAFVAQEALMRSVEAELGTEKKPITGAHLLAAWDFFLRRKRSFAGGM